MDSDEHTGSEIMATNSKRAEDLSDSELLSGLPGGRAIPQTGCSLSEQMAYALLVFPPDGSWPGCWWTADAP